MKLSACRNNQYLPPGKSGLHHSPGAELRAKDSAVSIVTRNNRDAGDKGNAYNIAGKRHVLMWTMSGFAFLEIATTHIMSTTIMTMKESLIPKPNAAGPMLPAPNLQKKHEACWHSQRTWNVREDIRICREPDEEYVI